jgi:hypothetical protein
MINFTILLKKDDQVDLRKWANTLKASEKAEQQWRLDLYSMKNPSIPRNIFGFLCLWVLVWFAFGFNVTFPTGRKIDIPSKKKIGEQTEEFYTLWFWCYSQNLLQC